MTEDTSTERSRTEKAIPWRWIIFGMGIVGVVVLLTVFAVDLPNVVWLDGKPHCPHCRTAVNAYSGLCTACRKTYDWTTDERICDLCLTRHDIARIRSLSDEEREAAILRMEGDDAARAAVRTWIKKIGHGECVFCAGTGKDLPSAEPCPICFGRKDCVLCNGDEEVVHGDRGAHDRLMQHLRTMGFLEGRLGMPPADKVQDATRDAVERLRGTIEVASVKDPLGYPLSDRARDKRDEILKVLGLRE